jgi:indolepyruvate ferredoxin oxidoreductase
VQSNCVALVPVETEFGRKRAVDQSSCNKDTSCIKGFCPSFVTVHGAKRHERSTETDFALPEITQPEMMDGFAMLITGVGGTGVVTIGAILAMAAHLEGKGAGVIDMAGLAQKGGPVTSHVRIAPTPGSVKAIRVAAAGADTILACDMVVAGTAKSLAAIHPNRTRVFVNTHETYPGEFTRDPDMTLPTQRLIAAIAGRAGAERTRAIEATEIATALLGDAIATNMFMLGLAWQSRAIPLSSAAIERAIELNGVDVAMNKAAFAWGRRAAVEPEQVAQIAAGLIGRTQPDVLTVDALVERRAGFLAAYQDEGYARRYSAAVQRIRAAEYRAAPGRDNLARAVAVNLFKLMAIKDEYEVARLYTDGSFEKQLQREFASWGKLEFHLAPPLLAREDKATGRPAKAKYGPWMLRGLRALAAMRRFRGTTLDPFRYSADRKLERRLLADYEETLALIGANLRPDNYLAAVALAAYPEKIRGYGPLKAESAAKATALATEREGAFLSGAPRLAEAAE